MHYAEIPPASLALLKRGAVIPAHLLALDAQRKLDERRQRAMSATTSTPAPAASPWACTRRSSPSARSGLYEPVLELAMHDGARPGSRSAAGARSSWSPALPDRPRRPCAKPRIARGLGYHAGLLSLAAMKGASEDALDRPLPRQSPR